jgi:hypothetical protein
MVFTVPLISTQFKCFVSDVDVEGAVFTPSGFLLDLYFLSYSLFYSLWGFMTGERERREHSLGFLLPAEKV